MNLVSHPKLKTRRTLKKRIMIITCEPRENEVMAGHRKLRIRGFKNITGLVKSRARVTQHIHKRNAHEILLVKPEGLRSFGRFGYVYVCVCVCVYIYIYTHTHTWGDNI